MVKTEILVLDASPFLKGKIDPKWAKQFFTIPEVLLEVRDKTARQNLDTTLVDIQVRNPLPASIRKIKKEATKTGDISTLSSTDIRVMALTFELSKEESETNSDDGDGWITPTNIKVKYEDKTVSCMTSDFAMQNTLLQMNLGVSALDGMIITRTKTSVLRCHACTKVTTKMDKIFCPACGNNTLIKTTAAIDSDGHIKCFLKKNFQYRNQGTKYSIPKYKGGQKSTDLILREDQKEFIKASRKKKKETDVFDLDYVPNLLKNLSLQQRAEKEVIVGYGRRNINRVRNTKK